MVVGPRDRGMVEMHMGAIRRAATLAAIAAAVVATQLVITSSTAIGSPPPGSASVASCIQGQLQVAMEQGGGLAGPVPETYGYTFLVVNIGRVACQMQGYPHEVIFSRSTGRELRVTVTHQATALYAQPQPQRVILRPESVASFAVSYRYGIVRLGAEPGSCQASLIDVRLPARLSSLFSYEFPVRFDGCAARDLVQITPVEGRSQPLPSRAATRRSQANT